MVADFKKGEVIRNTSCEICANTEAIHLLLPKVAQGRLEVCGACWEKIVFVAALGWKDSLIRNIIQKDTVDLSGTFIPSAF